MPQDDARDAIGARGTVGNACRVGFLGNCVESSPEYPRSAPLNACSRESHLSGNSWRNLPRSNSGFCFYRHGLLALALKLAGSTRALRGARFWLYLSLRCRTRVYRSDEGARLEYSCRVASRESTRLGVQPRDRGGSTVAWL